jgi:hypothetical protein
MRWLLVAVAVLAVDLGLIRWTDDLASRRHLAYYAVIAGLARLIAPSLSLLAVAAVNAGRGLARCGRASPFATGYLLCGGLVTLGVSLDMAAHGFFFDMAVQTYVRLLPTISFGPFDGWVDHALWITAYTLPQIAFALVGGALATRYGLALVLSRPTNPPVAVDPPDSERIPSPVPGELYPHVTETRP